MQSLVTQDAARVCEPTKLKTETALEVSWVRHDEELKAAQRLRYQVFHEEWGTQAGSAIQALDIDEFDPHCEHLIVKVRGDEDTPEGVIGTYRVMLPDSARRLGRYYTETEFDLSNLQDLRSTMAELGRSCIAPPWRTGGVILLLWSHLMRFLIQNGVQQAIGCASVPMPDGGANAARLWNELRGAHLAPEHRRVTPLHPLPVELLPSVGPSDCPPLVRGYLKVGAQVLGAPAWDSAFGCADLPMLLDFNTMSPAYRKRFIDSRTKM